jgi:hypothetical protein
MATLLYRGQGKVWMGTRDASGNPQNLRWVGNCPEAKIGLELTTIEHKESWSGQNLTDARMDTEKKASLSLTLESIQKENLQLCFRGSVTTVAAGSAITGEVLGAGVTTLAVGDLLKFAKRAATAVTIKDSTGTPKTLTNNVNYRLNATAGAIEILDLTTGGPFTGPLKADYTPGATTELGLFTTGSVPYFFFIEGLNTADSNNPVLIDLYKVLIDPSKQFDLITDDYAKFPIEGSVLMDDLKPSNAALGQFGAVYNLK